jgi:hypothetical protein
MAVEDLTVPRDRVDTITDFGAVERYGVLSAGGEEGWKCRSPESSPSTMCETHTQELEKRHTRGKLVLRP